jgi:signal transduction histidine kinase
LRREIATSLEVIRLRLLALLCAVLFSAFSAPCFAQSPILIGEASAPQKLASAEFVYSESAAPPSSGWQSTSLPKYDFFEVPTPQNAGRKTIWIRFLFDNRTPPKARLAFMADYTTERFIAYLNGREIYRNYSDPSAKTFASFQPAFVTLPSEQLIPGVNRIELRLQSDTIFSLGIGNVTIGAEQAVHDAYDTRYKLQFLGPQIINGIVAALTVFVFLFWLRRRKEQAFGWLALVGLVWWIRNLHYTSIDPILGPALMWETSVAAQFMLMVVFFGFFATVLELEHKRRWIFAVLLHGCILIVLRHILIALGRSDDIAFVLSIPTSIGMIYMAARAALRKPSVENIVMLVAINLALGLAIHDLGLNALAWQGASFFLQPYASLVVFSAFLITVGRRMLNAFGEVENMNVVLDQRVSEATIKLQDSEAARRDLQVARAVEHERERLMFEIHDGIGSNLVTALAVAEKQNESPVTIKTLKRSLSDLRLAVDSLEPLEGELPLLLASFRYRMEPELTAAGIGLNWQVQECPPLQWLDATGSLHILRILQEGISNIISHANASLITVACHAEDYGGLSGIAILISDNGTGLPSRDGLSGKGISIMQSRAQSLGAEFSYERNDPGGTLLALWLPIEIRKATKVSEKPEGS